MMMLSVQVADTFLATSTLLANYEIIRSVLNTDSFALLGHLKMMLLAGFVACAAEYIG